MCLSVENEFQSDPDLNKKFRPLLLLGKERGRCSVRRRSGCLRAYQYTDHRETGQIFRSATSTPSHPCPKSSHSDLQINSSTPVERIQQRAQCEQ